MIKKIQKNGVKMIDYNNIIFDEVIGNGGYSKVYSGWLDGKKVAIKEFKNVNETNLKRIVEEINIQVSLSHKNINKVLCLAFDVNPFKIACVNKFMIYNLRYVINSCKTDLKLRFNLAKQLMEGVDYLHSLTPPIIHRDLKPENILLDENFNLEICDFGVFKLLNHEKTETLNQFYTVRYAPPEIIKNFNFICKGSDAWSLGLILYEIFYQQQSWTNMNNEEIISSIKKERPFPIKQVENVPDIITNAIKMFCEYDYSLRPKIRDVFKEIAIWETHNQIA